MFAGVPVTSPSSVAEGSSDGASVKKAGLRGTKSATAPITLSNRRGEIMFVHVLIQCYFVSVGMLVPNQNDCSLFFKFQ